MASLSRIRTPFGQHIRRFRFQILPVLFFIGAVALTTALWDHQRNRQWATGEADEVSVDLSFNTDGTLIEIDRERPLQLMDMVYKHEIIARLDPRPTIAELAVVQAEVDQLRAELNAATVRLVSEQTDRRYDRLMAGRRLALDVERHQLDLLDRRARLQTDRIELLRLEADLAAFERAYRYGGETTYTVENSRMLRDAAAKQVQGEEVAIEEAIAQLAQLKERLAGQDALDEPDEQGDALLSPIRKAIATQQARIRVLELQRESLTIVSPIEGMVSAVNYQPGQAVRAGVPVVKVTSIHPGDVVSYLREGHEFRPKKGEKAYVRSRSGRRTILQGVVVDVGPEYERIPTHQLRDPLRPEYGLSVRITLNDPESLMPGELVDVTFTRTE